MFSPEQHAQLEAMGFVLYRPYAETPAPAPAAKQKPASDFWQSALGLNVAKWALGIDTGSLVIEPDVRSWEAKKRLWHQLRALRKAR